MPLRNVVCISHIDPKIHDWFKQEATRRSQQAGKRVALAKVIGQALLEFKEKLEVLHG